MTELGKDGIRVEKDSIPGTLSPWKGIPSKRHLQELASLYSLDGNSVAFHVLMMKYLTFGVWLHNQLYGKKVVLVGIEF